MIILKEKDPLGNSIVLEETQWNHIVFRHPEMMDKLDDVKTVISDPDYIFESIKSSSVWVYQRKTSQGEYLSLVINLDKKFIITGYLSENVKKGVLIWQKN